MPIPATIQTPKLERFLFAPDAKTMELYIVCTQPLALIWVRQTIPAQLYIIEGPQKEQLLRDAAEWYKANAAKSLDQN